MAEPFTALIMAAGHGTRMKSELPKVLHPVCGKPMVGWVIDAAREAGADEVVCITRPGEGVEEGLPDDVTVAEQTEGEGTGAAVLAARGQVPDDRPLAVLSGDHPLVAAEVISSLVDTHAATDANVTVLTTESLDPAGYGRVMRTEDGIFDRIVETKRTEGVPEEVLATREVNLGTYVFEPEALFAALESVEEQDGELYLTAAITAFAAERQVAISSTTDADVAPGGQQPRGPDGRRAPRPAQADRASTPRTGSPSPRPDTIELHAGVTIGEDTRIGVGASLLGATKIGQGCDIGPHVTMKDVTFGDRAGAAHSALVEAEVGEEAMIGPFSYLRPGARIGARAKVGAFVEVKGSNIGEGAKVPHLSYIGDADVGEGANVAAGNITANYDGATSTARRSERT